MDIFLELDFCKTISYKNNENMNISCEKEECNQLLVFLSEDIKELRDIVSVSCELLSCKIDHTKGFVSFKGAAIHSDPCFPIFNDIINKYRMEIVLYGRDAGQCTCVHIERERGHDIRAKVHYAILNMRKEKNILSFAPQSRVSFSDKRRPKVYVNGNGLDAQVILQSEINGIFSEKIIYSKKNDKGGAVELPPLWADHYGVVVSFGNQSAHNFEHKHIIQGHFNKPATRVFYKNGEFYDNSKSFPYLSIVGLAETIEDIKAILSYKAYEYEILLPNTVDSLIVEFAQEKSMDNQYIRIASR